MDQLKKDQFLEILKKYQSGNASKEEVEFLDAYYKAFEPREGFTDDLKDEDRLVLEADLMASIKKNTANGPTPIKDIQRKPILRWEIKAAAVIILLGVGLLYHVSMNRPTQTTTVAIQNDIAPGGNKAILTLSDGKKISLTDAGNGKIAESSGIRITKAADGQLLYTILPESGTSTKGYNTIETPKGGQYQITLPDGSKVWLNAASSLTYPVSFASLGKRKVELTGEAYFEVAKDKSSPFLVVTDNLEVEVLGTHFNVSNYKDDESAKTTLIEGSVKVLNPLSDHSQLLTPGQQSIIQGAAQTIRNVDTREAVAWKNGNFRFDDERLESIMRRISRWYDVEVVWQDAVVKNEHFAAVTTRFANVSQLLKRLEQTGDVKFEIEGRKITIKKKDKLTL